MQLTNYGFIESRGNYIAARSNYERPMERLSTGLKINHSRDDVGALSSASRSRVDVLQNNSRRTNLQNFVSFLDLQRDSLESVRRIYERVNILAHDVLDPTKSASDRASINEEYVVLKNELDEILDKEFNGTRLFGGKSADFSDGLEDAVSGGSPTVKEVTKDVGTTAGKLELKFSTGRAPDQLTVLQGGEIIFKTGPWRTFGGSHDGADGRKDTFTVEFAPHCPTNVTLTPHSVNDAAAPASDASLDPRYPNGLSHLQRSQLEAQGLFLTKEAKGESTLLTIRAENSGNTATYLVDAAFEPDLPANDKEISIGSGSETSTYGAIAFGRLGCISDIKTEDMALEALASLKGDLDGLSDSLAANAAARNRFSLEINSLELGFVAQEHALSRLEDADMAQEAIKFAKQSLKMELAANIMSRVTRLTDVLLPLATQRVGGSSL